MNNPSWKPDRRSDVASAFLAAIATVLVVFTGYLYLDVSQKIVSLNAGIKEDSLWAVYQLDAEATKFVDIIGDEPEETDISSFVRDLVLRYDILWSRIDLLTKSEYSRQFADNENHRNSVNSVALMVKIVEHQIDLIKSNKSIEAVELDFLRNHFSSLTNITHSLLAQTNAIITSERAERRADVYESTARSERVFIALIFSILALLVFLRKQILDSRKITQRAQSFARELEEAYVQAESGNRAKSSFIATISHEIRTPLNAVIGLSELLQEKPLPADVLADVSSIRNSGEILLEILNEVLDYSAIENGKLQIEERSFDLGLMISETLSIFRMAADSKGIHLAQFTDDKLSHRWIKSDPTRVRQVLVNLLGNAIKFTQKGTVSVHADCRIGNGPDELILEIEVRDTGDGISKEGKERLFKPFSQVDSTITRIHGGTGLGLSICKGIVDRMSGKIGFESLVGVGSTFWFELPVRRSENVPKAEKVRPDQISIETKRILLVEDNLTNRNVAIAMLKSLNQNVEYACDGKEGVEMASVQAYDLIFMDMQMPVMSGIEATTLIRQRTGPNQRTPIIAMTANASEADRKLCYEAGMDTFESKPVRKARLIQIISGHGGPSDPGNTNETIRADKIDATDIADKTEDTLGELNPERSRELIEELGQEVYDELWFAFCEEAIKLDRKISHAAAAGDFEEVKACLHTLKGASLNIGLDHLAELAERMRSGAEGLESQPVLHRVIRRHVSGSRQVLSNPPKAA